MSLLKGDKFEANISTPINQTEIKPIGRSTLILKRNMRQQKASKMNVIIYIRVKPYILFSTLIKPRFKKEKFIPIFIRFSCDTYFSLVVFQAPY